MSRFYSRGVRRRPLQTLITEPHADFLFAVGLFAWAAPDVPWWWRPAGHVPATIVVVGYLLLAIAMSAPFMWRRRFPVAVLVACSAVLASRWALHKNLVAVFVAVLIAAYGVGAYGTISRRYARWVGWLSLVTAIAADIGRYGSGRLSAVPFAMLGTAFLVGDASSARRIEFTSALDAAHVQERTRIARELHDVVAHQLSAIAVQAGVARLAAETTSGTPRSVDATSSVPSTISTGDPGTASSTRTLATIEQLAREALDELSHLLGVLRHETTDNASRRPSPSLTELEGLIGAYRAAEVDVDYRVVGCVRSLSPGLEVSAYRIVQESLTNAGKHAPGAAIHVTLTYGPVAVELRIVNDRSPSVSQEQPRQNSSAVDPGGGRGLVGMSERVGLYDGTFASGHTPGGGYEVIATFPCDRVESAG